MIRQPAQLLQRRALTPWSAAAAIAGMMSQSSEPTAMIAVS
jgi:hypothetical protein